MTTKQARPSLAGLMAEVHRLASGRSITVTEALRYFRNPERLAEVIQKSGLLHDPQRRQCLQQLLATQEQEESAHGL